MSIETQLRDALTSHASSIEPTEARPYERVAGAVAKNRTRRRTVGAAAVAVVAAIAIGVPTVSSRLADGRPSPAGTSVTLPPAGDKAWDDISTWPTRGKLAGDATLIKALKAKFPGNVLFVEDLGNERVAVLATQDTNMTLVSGPDGAAGSELTYRGNLMGGFEPSGVVTLSTTTHIVILTTPAHNSAKISPPGTEPKGPVTDAWTDVALIGGVGRAANHPTAVISVGKFGFSSATFGLGHGERALIYGMDPRAREKASLQELFSDHTPPMDVPLGDAQEKATTALAAKHFKVPAEQITTRTAYRGRVPYNMTKVGVLSGPNPDETGEIQILHSTLPDGTVVRTVALETKDGIGPGHTDLRETLRAIEAPTAYIHPFVNAGSRADPLVNADAAQHVGAKTVIHVVVPSGAAVRFVAKNPDRWPATPTVQLKDGFAEFTMDVPVADFNRDYTVQTLDADGNVLGTFADLDNDGPDVDLR